jgi:ABC-type sugar transport system ATPase subunit
VKPDGISIDHLTFRIGSFVMEELSLVIPQGQYFVLTGPNGAGKTILLKLIAGLFKPERGTIRIDGRDVTGLPPWKRGLGAIQQDGLLFPNRTVRDNIGFGLEIRGLGQPERDRAVEEVAGQFNILPLLDRMPAGLSGGERQKASLARTLVLKPSVLLLDEPLSAIDEGARDDLLRRELKAIQRQSGITVVHVAHNRQEIELVADRVGVMTGGRLCSVEAPEKRL